MNATRLILSLLLVAFPALALPAARRTRHPRRWAVLLTTSLAAGFVLIEASLAHALLPHLLAKLGLTEQATACKLLGGHVSAANPAASLPLGLLAIVIGGRALSGATGTLRRSSAVRQGARPAPTTRIGGYDTITLPLQHRWAVAMPGASPPVVLSTALVETLQSQEVQAIVRHEMAHVRHHHDRFLLLANTIATGLWFLPWTARAAIALRLTLERWADEEAASEAVECRGQLCSALHKLAKLTPSAMASHRIAALEAPPARASTDTSGWTSWTGWTAAASIVIPLAVGLALTLILHAIQVVHAASGTVS